MIRFEWQAAWVKHDMHAKGVIEVIRHWNEKTSLYKK